LILNIPRGLPRGILFCCKIMPELPEVETTLQGIQPHIQHQIVQQVVIRHFGLRWPIPKNIIQQLQNQRLLKVERRAKYLLLQFKHGTAIIHLGMSGRLRILKQPISPQKHDHFDILFANKIILRFTDPRRFGAFLWTEAKPHLHPLLCHLGPEPLQKTFSYSYLWQVAQERKVPLKTLIMDPTVVVGIGNIYANEALFMAGLHPNLRANQLSLKQTQALVKAIKYVLRRAIQLGGTTLQDFLKSDGKPGYFANQLQVYGRAGLPCLQCHALLVSVRIGQRSTVFCPRCQKK